jgi:hypothetical protein
MKQIFLLIALIAFFHAVASSQTTEFTYQGNLQVGPSPSIAQSTTVNYDFDFRLCAAELGNCSAAPGLIGIDQHANVPVTDGIFTVKLSFTAANAFDGSPRWLQIAIKPAGDPGGYLVLNPRQQLTSTPYAIRSKNSEQLGGIASSQYLQTNGNGASLMNLNAGNITTGTLAIANGGTGSATKNFVDLSTDQTNIGGNKTFTGNLTINGNVGIGGAGLGQRLNVSGFGGVRANVNSDSNAGLGLTLNNQAKWSVATVSPGQFQIFNDAIGQNAIWIDPTNNNVGIGSSSPGAKLEVNGYTKLGSDAPSIRMKVLTGTTPSTEGGSVTIPHGLDSTKILSVSVMVNYNSGFWIGPDSNYNSNTRFSWVFAGVGIGITNNFGASAGILSKPIKILIIYEQ